jgi:hypothetical protein
MNRARLTAVLTARWKAGRAPALGLPVEPRPAALADDAARARRASKGAHSATNLAKHSARSEAPSLISRNGYDRTTPGTCPHFEIAEIHATGQAALRADAFFEQLLAQAFAEEKMR